MSEQREVIISRDPLFNSCHVNREAALAFSMGDLRTRTAACDRCQRNRAAARITNLLLRRPMSSLSPILFCVFCLIFLPLWLQVPFYLWFRPLLTGLRFRWSDQPLLILLQASGLLCNLQSMLAFRFSIPLVFLAAPQRALQTRSGPFKLRKIALSPNNFITSSNEQKLANRTRDFVAKRWV